MASQLQRLLLAYAYCIASSAWVYTVASIIPAGRKRLMLCLPVVVTNLCLTPLLLDYQKEPMLVTPVGGVFSLSAFKVLALCIGRGPLTVFERDWWRFLAVMQLPVIPYQVFKLSRGTQRPRQVTQAREMVVSYLQQMGGAMVVASILLAEGLPVLIRHWLYTLSTSLFLSGAFDGLSAFAISAFQLPVAPTFDKPWLCSSFADFWARRWNLTTTYMLRVLVYEPIMEGRWVPKTASVEEDCSPSGPQEEDKPAGEDELKKEPEKKVPGPVRSTSLKRFLALEATFLFSGVWHILLFWYNTRVISWRWCMFFTLQGPILFVESLIKKLARKHNIQLPWIASVVLANVLLIVIARPLFFGPCDDTGFCGRCLEAFRVPRDMALSWGWSKMQVLFAQPSIAPALVCPLNTTRQQWGGEALTFTQTKL